MSYAARILRERVAAADDDNDNNDDDDEWSYCCWNGVSRL